MRGGRATVAMEGAARYSGIKILTAEDRVGAGGGWLGKVMGKPVSLLSLALSCIPADSQWFPPIPPATAPLELAPPQPSPGSPLLVLPVRLASCTEGSEWPLSRRPVYQHDNSKLVLLKGIQRLSQQTSAPQRGPAMPSPQNLLNWGLLRILIDFLPPTTLNAFNLLLQMANFENPLIRIRSSTSIFIYFSFS